MARVTIVVSSAGRISHACLCGPFRCILLLAQARPRMMQHLSSIYSGEEDRGRERRVSERGEGGGGKGEGGEGEREGRGGEEGGSAYLGSGLVLDEFLERRE